MRITIVGGGNIGTQFAVHCAEKGHETTVFTSTPDLFEKRLYIVDDSDVITREGVIKLATNDPKEAFRYSDLIIVTSPPSMMKSIADIIYEHADSGPVIGVVPGNGGGECAFRKCVERGNVFFGIERVPAIARLVQKGKIVKSTGYREELNVAALPRKSARRCAKLIESIFEKKTNVIPCYLNLTITPSNPILHTTRLRSLFRDWHEGVVYDSVPLFYEEWDNSSSELLLACDEEVQSICHSLPEFDLQFVKSLRVHYESPTVEAMTRKISSIQAFKGLKTPTVNVEGGLIPDLHSRYFTADFSYGLVVIRQIAGFAGVKIPNIDETIEWYKGIAVETDEFRFEDYGIVSRESFQNYYSL